MFLLTLSFRPANEDKDDKEGSPAPPPPQPHLAMSQGQSRGHCHHSPPQSQLVTYISDNYCENGRSDWPGTADLVCQPVTLTKGKSLLWLVAPVAGLAAARPLYTWSEPVPAQSLSGAGGDNLSLARLSRYLLMPGTPVHGTERERGVRALDHWPHSLLDWGLGILHKGTHFTMKRKYVILGRDYHVSVCQGSGGARRM